MWNQIGTDENVGIMAETITMIGHNGERIDGYFSRPLGKGPFPGIILIPYMSWWNEFYHETSHRFAQHGYITVCPDIYCRFGHGTPEEIYTKVQVAGGISDDSVMGDCEVALKYLNSLPYSSGKVGVIGMSAGGRHAFLAACRVKGIGAVVDCWGDRVVTSKENLTDAQPVAPIDYTDQLSCPLLGLFGNEDRFPAPNEVDLHEEELKKYGKNYKFYRYDGAGHGFWYYHTDWYRPVQAMDAWQKVFDFFGEYLHNLNLANS